jgi:hypothetical protein
MGRVYISYDVVFGETVFPFKSLSPNVGALLRKQIFLLDPPLRNFESGDDATSDLCKENTHATNPFVSHVPYVLMMHHVGIQTQAKISARTVLPVDHTTHFHFQVETTVAHDPMQIP